MISFYFWRSWILCFSHQAHQIDVVTDFLHSLTACKLRNEKTPFYSMDADIRFSSFFRIALTTLVAVHKSQFILFRFWHFRFCIFFFLHLWLDLILLIIRRLVGFVYFRALSSQQLCRCPFFLFWIIKYTVVGNLPDFRYEKTKINDKYIASVRLGYRIGEDCRTPWNLIWVLRESTRVPLKCFRCYCRAFFSFANKIS